MAIKDCQMVIDQELASGPRTELLNVVEILGEGEETSAC
jgi:hypothetical protein